MVLWDVALDPAMSTAFPFWRFEADGVYFGMPLANWAGWFLTSAVIVWGYDRLLGGLRAAAPGATALYAANVLFPVCICLAYGVAWAGVVGLAALAVPLALLRLRRAEEPRGAAPREAVAARTRAPSPSPFPPPAPSPRGPRAAPDARPWTATSGAPSATTR